MKTRSYFRLVLFDVDGTLISTNGIARQCFADAIEQVFQFTSTATTHDFRGKTDQLIYREIMKVARVPEHLIEGQFEAVFESFYAFLEARLNTENITIMPGIRELLNALLDEENVLPGLLTGNMIRGAKIKLAPPQLNRYFSFGAFGSDALFRYELPSIAIDRAYKRTGYMYRDKEIVIIGDTELDIECGRHLNVRSIAVATGGTPREKLASHKPDFLFDNFLDTQQVIEAIIQ